MTNKTPHKHAELIKQWADGAVIQWRSTYSNIWADCHNNLPVWHSQSEYRVRPEPKPDVILYAMINKEKDPFDNGVRITHVRANDTLISTDTCMFVFDGETGALKDAQVLAKG